MLRLFQVYYPFDTKGISVFDQGNEKVYLIPTRDNFWEWGGTKTYSLKVKFVNEEKKSGNWPNGTCSGPYPLGNIMM